MAAPEDIVVFPGGDVTMVCSRGDNHKQTRIVASSVMLSQASPVFSRLLRPGFSEGDTLTKNANVEIPFPDDNPRAMEILVKALHCHPSVMGFEMTPTIVMCRAVLSLVDKYDCATSVLAIASRWIAVLHDQARTVSELRHLLEMAYVLRNPALFASIGREILSGSRGREVLSYGDCSEPVERALDWLFKEREQWLDIASEWVEDQIENISWNRNAYDEQVASSCTFDCMCEGKHVVVLLRTLKEENLWPSHMLRRSSLREAIRAMKEIDFVWPTGMRPCSHDCAAFSYPTGGEASKVFHNRAASIEASIERADLCLWCVEAGKAECGGRCQHKTVET